MANVSDYLREQLLDHVTDSVGGIWVAPTTLYLALLQTEPVAGDVPSVDFAKELYDAATDGYLRQAIVWDSAGAGIDGLIENEAVITHGPASGSNWPLAAHYWIVDTSSFKTGNILFYGTLVSSKQVDISDSAVTAIGELELTLV